MAQTLLSSGAAERGGGESYQVVVHVDAATLADNDDEQSTSATTERAPANSSTAPRCTPKPPAGSPATRAWSASSNATAGRCRSAARPAACRRRSDAPSKAATRSAASPAAPNAASSHAHHVDHWAHGGRTDLSNLVQLCAHHHRLVHEGGYTIEPGPRARCASAAPTGTPCQQPAPPAGEQHELQHHNREHGLDLTDQTCVPHIYPGDRLDLHWVVDNLAETDSRLTPATG